MTQTAPDAPHASTDSICPNPACHAANRAGTRFCASCGTALLAAPLPGAVPTPPPYAAPPQPPRFQGASTFNAVPTDKTADIQMAPEWAFHHVIQALQAMGGDITSQTPPQALTATLTRKGVGNPIRFRCQVNLQPTGPATSRIAYGIKVEWNSTFLVLGILVAAGAFNMMFLTMSIGLWAPLLSVAAIGWAVYDYGVGIPNRLAAQLHKQLLAPATGQAAPAPAPAAPAPNASNVMPLPTAPVTPTPQPVNRAPAPVSVGDDIVARIEKLAMLKEKGLISEAEFDKRRAELLDRL